MSPEESESADPQQRVLLDVTVEAIENAGIPLDSLKGSNTSVFIGISNFDYMQKRLKSENLKDIGVFDAIGNIGSAAAGRISYLFNFHGPSMVVDTACSSSLVGIHQACQSLRYGESDLSIVGGVNPILTPNGHVVFSQMSAISRQGICKPFDDNADGFVRSEGCGVSILKRLSDAERDNDNILAVIKGSAVNQDGKTNGLSAPNGISQQQVINKALDNAKISPSQVNYLEAHGTGTLLGDPIEMEAIAEIHRKRDSKLYVGSVKSNMGHLEAASGMASLLKVILALKKRRIPASVNFEKPSSHINWQPYIEVPNKAVEYAAAANMIAGISSFGLSGTNARVILEEYVSEQVPEASDDRSAHMLCLSAKSEYSLNNLKDRYIHFLENTSETLADICYAAAACRTHFRHRLAIVGQSLEELIKALKSHGNILSEPIPHQKPKVAFLFTGQGSQYCGICKELYESEPLFRGTIDQCHNIAAQFLDKPLKEVIFDQQSEQLIHQTTYTQPALFTIEYALAKLWISWGIKPDVLIGHSVGEYVAACIAGVFGLDDALKLISLRGKLMGSLPDGGGMLNVLLDHKTVKGILNDFQQLSIAAINSPQQTVVSGPNYVLDQLASYLHEIGKHYQRLKVSHAFHSELMAPILEEFLMEANKIVFQSPTLPIVSNLTGDFVTDQLARGSYWRDQLRSCVNFYQGIHNIVEHGCDLFIEIGPKPTLANLMLQSETNVPADSILPSINPKYPDRKAILKALQNCYQKGINIDLRKYFGNQSWNKITLPNYAFDRQRYWIDETQVDRSYVGASSSRPHPLLGPRLNLAGEEVIFTMLLEDLPGYLEDHKIMGSVIFPAAGYIEMALSAGIEMLGEGIGMVIEDLQLHQALVLGNDKAGELQTVLTRDGTKEYLFRILSHQQRTPDQAISWITHASGKITKGSSKCEDEALTDLSTRCRNTRDIAGFYDLFSQSGISYGKEFRTVVEINYGEDEGLGHVIASPDPATAEYALHPVILDGSFQVLAGVLSTDNDETLTYLPISIDRLEYQPQQTNTVLSHVAVKEL